MGFVVQGNVIVARQLAKRRGDQGILSISVNPGNIQSGLQRHVPAMQRRIMVRLLALSNFEPSYIRSCVLGSQNAVLLNPTPYGALTQLFAGTMPEALQYNGEVYHMGSRI